MLKSTGNSRIITHNVNIIHILRTLDHDKGYMNSRTCIIVAAQKSSQARILPQSYLNLFTGVDNGIEKNSTKLSIESAFNPLSKSHLTMKRYICIMLVMLECLFMLPTQNASELEANRLEVAARQVGKSQSRIIIWSECILRSNIAS